jgi:hypothetical protein
MRAGLVEREVAPKYPIRGIFAGCCASALAPHIVSATMIAKSPTHFGYFDIAQYRFWIADFGFSENDLERNRFMGVHS